MEKKFKPLRHVEAKIDLPGDREIALIAAFLGSLAEGETVLEGYPKHKTCLRLLEFITQLGVCIKQEGNKITIDGKGKNGWERPDRALDVDDSEKLLKLLIGALVGQKFDSRISGNSFFSLIPMDEIIQPLQTMKADLTTEFGDHLPVMIRPSQLEPAAHELHIMEPYTKNCILAAGLFADGTTGVTEPSSSADHMERLLPFWGGEAERAQSGRDSQEESELERRIRKAKEKKTNRGSTEKKTVYSVSIKGPAALQGKKYSIPGDATLATYLCVLVSILKKSELYIENVSLNPARIGAIRLLQRMGADIEVIKKQGETNEPFGDLHARSAVLNARKMGSEEMVNMIDEVPAVVLAAAFTEGRTVIRNIERLRNIDSDCITALMDNLKQMGVKAGELPDGMVIDGQREYDGAAFDACNDARIGMAFSIAGLCCRGESTLQNAEPVIEQFPEFFSILEKLESPAEAKKEK